MSAVLPFPPDSLDTLRKIRKGNLEPLSDSDWKFLIKFLIADALL